SFQLEGRCDTPPTENATSFTLPQSTGCPRQPRMDLEYTAPDVEMLRDAKLSAVIGQVPSSATVFDINSDGMPDFVGPSADVSDPRQPYAMNASGRALNVLGEHGYISLQPTAGLNGKIFTPSYVATNP